MNNNLFRVVFPKHHQYDTSVFADDEEMAIKHIKADPLFKKRFPNRAPEMVATFSSRAGGG